MKRIRLLLATLGLLLIGVLSVGAVATAHDFRSGSHVSLGQDEVVRETLFLAGDTIDIRGEVFGDIFCAGQTITIIGVVHGDVICAGSTVNIGGEVDGDIRVAGQTITQSAEVGGGVTVLGQSYSLQEGGRVDRDLTLAGVEAIINGTVGRDMALSGEKVTIAGEVGGNMRGEVGALTLSSGADIHGDIEYTSNSELNQAEDATVSGEITHHQPEAGSGLKIAGFGLLFFLNISMLLMALILALLLPRIFHRTSESAMDSPWKTLGAGFFASFAVPILSIILFATLFGMPLAILLLAAWFVIAMLSGPFTAYYLGRLLVPNTVSKKPIVIMLIGAVLLSLLYLIPVVSIFVLLFAYWMGSGMILTEFLRRSPPPEQPTAGVPKKNAREPRASAKK